MKFEKIILMGSIVLLFGGMVSGCERRSDGELILLSSTGKLQTAENGGSVQDIREIVPDPEAGETVETAGTEEAEEKAASGQKPSDRLIVHICGQVKHPGVYEFDPGDRIYQAIQAAGGLTEEAAGDCLNQAELLTDGSRIYVPSGEEAEELYSTGKVFLQDEGRETTRSEDKTVNINTADERTLCTLNGIGSSKAKSIIAYRTQNGRFRSIEEIKKVEGIGDGLFAKIKDAITV